MDPKLQDEAGRLAALDRYRLRTASTDGIDGFQRITDLVADLFGASVCTVSIINDDVQYFAGVSGGEHGLTDRSDAVCAQTIRTNEPLLIADLSQDARFAAKPFVTDERHFRGYAGVPLTSPCGYNLGALCVIDREPRHFSAEETYLLKRFAGLVVEQMELRTLADHDYLTGATSRRAFTGKAAAVLRRAKAGKPAALIAIDVDHFKSVNDRFGHGVGDAVLKALVATLGQHLRPNDLIGRIGGEEFAVLLPDCGPDAALAIAERYREAISAMRVEGIPPITASLGVATSDERGGFDPWLADADAALYEAKRTGRDRVIASGALQVAA